MLGLLIIPAIIGAGYAFDFINDKIDEYEDEVAQQQAEDARNAALQNQQNANDGIRVSGDDTDEFITGTPGDDSLFGDAGSDAIVGGAGDDRIFLGSEDDVSKALVATDDEGDDFIRGGAGDDLIADTKGSNEIFGDLGDDTLISIDGLTAEGTITPDTPYTPDSIHGGYGEDILVGDAGDTLTGGTATDQFIVAAPSDDAHAPAVITDFDPETETLSIVFMDETPSDTHVNFKHEARTGLVYAFVEGEEVATLEGLSAADLQKINGFVTTLPDLMEQAAT